MAQTGYTPIQLYRSTTAAAAPSAGNLAAGELAINTTDEKLYFKNTAGTVKVIATTGAGVAGGSNTQVQYNSSGVLSGSASFVFDGTSLLVGKSSVSGLGEILGVNRTSDGTTAMIGRNGGSTNPYARFIATDASALTTIDANSSAGTPALALSANSSEIMRLTGGNVGIGTSSPTAISGYTALMLNNATNGSILDLAQAGTVRGRLVATTAAFVAETTGTIPIVFSPTGSEKARITDTGRLGIGTSSPATTFDVNGASAGNVVAVSASAVDCATGNYFTKTASGALTWTFTNVPASRAFIFALQLTNGGSGTQTWPAAVVWDGGTAPTLQASGTDILVFVTSDSGTTWRGVRGWKQA